MNVFILMFIIVPIRVFNEHVELEFAYLLKAKISIEQNTKSFYCVQRMRAFILIACLV